MDVEGWHPDPYGIHEERLYAHGEPTPLVRDGGIGFFDPHPLTDAWGGGGPEANPWVAGPSARSHSVRRPTKPMMALAGVLIAAGVVVGILGITGAGGNGSATSGKTRNPLVQAFLHLPRATVPLIPPQSTVSTSTTDLSSIEQALRALPRTTVAPATAPAAAPRSSATSPAPPSRVTQPPKRAAPAVAAPTVPATTLPVTTTTTPGQVDLGWYLADGSAFNTLQTDIEKLDRALASTGPSGYATVHPYWQGLHVDAGFALSLPPIPDAATQSEWATALGDLSEGAAECIIGSAGSAGTAGFVPTIFNQGTALITTGTTQLDQTLTSVESLAAGTSVPSRSAVRGWNQAHAALISTVQADIDKLNAAFSSASPSTYSTLTPFWQQLQSDAQSAMNQTPVPDPLIQRYWSTALNDLIQGASDCIGSSEALPPNLFDQGVASIDSGSAYLKTAVDAVQSLVA